jgi:signal transduction histidine kinase
MIHFPEQVEKIELNPELRRNLFLVMKEALNNAAKYSKAQNITLDFKHDGITFNFTISDDGIGIEEGVIRGTGNGMINMRKRMDHINGQFKLISSPGRGTSVVLEGPLY